MTDTPPAVTAPAPLTFAQPPEFATSIQMGRAMAALLRADAGVMPDKVADALMASAGAGGDIGVLENQIEALYDWACYGADCPDDARRAAYGGAFLFSAFSFGAMGKNAAPDQPKRADSIRAELRRQMGDPAATVTEDQRPAPKGVYVPAPAAPVVKATVAQIAALAGKIATLKDGLASGAVTADQAATQLDQVHTDALAMTGDPDPTSPAA